MGARLLTRGSGAMRNVGRFAPVFEMQGNSFLNIQEKLVRCISLRENIFADATGAPSILILVNFHFHEHSEDLDKQPTAISIALDSWFLKFVRIRQGFRVLSRRFKASHQYVFIFAHSFELESFSWSTAT